MFINLWIDASPLWNKKYMPEREKKKLRTVSITKVVCKTKHAFALRLRVPMLITILQCICSNVPKKSSDNLPAPTPTSPLRRSHSAAGQRSRLRSKYLFRSCRSENQNTSVILPRRWSSYVIWFVRSHSSRGLGGTGYFFSGIDEQNSNTSCSVWIVGRSGRIGRMGM